MLRVSMLLMITFGTSWFSRSSAVCGDGGGGTKGMTVMM